MNCANQRAWIPAALILAFAVQLHGQLPPNLPSQSPATAPAEAFVRRNNTQLVVGNQTFYFSGANFYSAMVNAAGGSTTRPQVTKVFETMQDLGLTVLRTWAFNDLGVNNTWQALQTAPTVFDERVFSEGLDWVVSEAPKYGVKLLLVLTNYQMGYGGAYQYVKWAGGTNILDFYTNPTILGWYKNNVKTIIGRTNTINRIKYAEDPAIFGWELINEPNAPGDDSGTLLTNWVDTMSAYVKSLDSNHLVAVGVEGFFGASTPELLAVNPSPSLNANANGGNPSPYNAICEGQDFFRVHNVSGIDITMLHLYPDFWASGFLDFQLNFSRQYIEKHMQVSQTLQKPLIIGELGKEPPLADRNTYLAAVYDMVAQSAQSSNVLAGTMVWTLGTSPEYPYVQGFDAFNIYPDPGGYLQAPPAPYIAPTVNAMRNAENAEFYGWANSTACFAKYTTAPHGVAANAPSPSDGWNDTLTLMRKNAAVLAAANGALPSAAPLTAAG